MSFRRKQLKQVLDLLAKSAEEQDAHLQTIGLNEAHGNDELALEFEDAFISAHHLHADGFLDDHQLSAAVAVNELLLRWSGQQHREFWTRTALWNDPRWTDVRTAAALASRALRDC